jgi:hypothetical protein
MYKTGYAGKTGILPEMEKRKEGCKNAAGQVPLMAKFILGEPS